MAYHFLQKGVGKADGFPGSGVGCAVGAGFGSEDGCEHAAHATIRAKRYDPFHALPLRFNFRNILWMLNEKRLASEWI